ncbi:MAG: hypothetical protein ACLT98_16915 [Eggerthellaceae bacterium]
MWYPLLRIGAVRARAGNGPKKRGRPRDTDGSIGAFQPAAVKTARAKEGKVSANEVAPGLNEDKKP